MRQAVRLSAELPIVCAVLLGAAPAGAEWKSKGEVGLEGRAFDDDNNPLTEDYGTVVLGRLEASHRHDDFQEKLRVLGRVDHQDQGRSVVIAEEAWAEYKSAGLRLRVGADIVNWTATEAFHPADVINSRNFDADLETYEKLGEPMAAATYQIGSGSVQLMVMPFFTTPIFASPASRQSFAPPGVRLGEPLRMDRDGRFIDGDYWDRRFGAQGALRYAQTIGKADVSLHVVHHLDRSQPNIVLDPILFEPRPLFRYVTQVGGTYQQVLGPVVAKVEGAYRMFATPEDRDTFYGRVDARDHGQVAAGLEYGWTHDSGYDSTIIVEGQALLGVTQRKRRHLSPFQGDVLVGYRLAFNDADSKELLLSAIADVEGHDEYLGNLSYSQRLAEVWSVKAALRLFFAPAPASPLGAAGLQPLRDSDHVRLSVIRHF